jgi:NAD(P)-dependent dehydrogenase (short-subunit alcohol dehydrogenase family)
MLEWDKLMNLNVRASFQISSLAVPFLKLHKGTITVLSSNAGETPQPGSIIFSTSMAMLNMFVKTTALETSFHGVRINAVAPGVTISASRMKKDSLNFTAEENRNFLQDSAQDIPLLNLLNHPGDVACSMLFLGSEEASFITGEILVMDGGQSLTSNNYPDYIKSLSKQIN